MDRDELLMMGKMSQGIEDLTKSVIRVEGTLVKLDDKIERKQGVQDKRIGVVENRISKYRGFYLAMFILFPLITGAIFLLAQ